MKPVVKIILLISLHLAITSCDGPDNLLHETMDDGQKIILKNDASHYYESEDQFLSDIPVNIPCDYSFLSKDEGQYEINVNYSIDGYDDRFIGAWEKATFGDWITEYGLIPNKEYYSAWIKYIVYLPISDNADYIPVFPMGNMGYVSWTNRPCFDVEYKKGFPKEILYTYVRYIGYDQNKKGIYKEIPKLNNLIWKFTLKD